MLRAVALLRERYGLSASETMAMTLTEFREWLEALDETKETTKDDGRESFINVEAPGECSDPGSIRRIVQKFI
jgi:hypothetical protein